jgi:hypothetical protein
MSETLLPTLNSPPTACIKLPRMPPPQSRQRIPRLGTTRRAVIEHLTIHMTRDDDKVFMRALRQEDRQSIAVMIDLIHAAFRAVVAEKRRAILAKKPEPDVH